MEVLIALGPQILSILGGSSILIVIVNAIVNRKKTRAEANNADVSSASAVFEMQRKHIEDQGKRLADLEGRLARMEETNEKLNVELRSLRGVVWDQQSWISKVYKILTPEQREVVGEPPHMAYAPPASAPTPNTIA